MLVLGCPSSCRSGREYLLACIDVGLWDIKLANISWGEHLVLRDFKLANISRKEHLVLRDIKLARTLTSKRID